MAILPDPSRATFLTDASGTNPYFPLDPGRIQSSIGFSFDPETSVTVESRDDVWTTEGTFVVDGITCRVVRDTVVEDGKLVEDTADWYASDTDGNVWYLGERVLNYEYDNAGNFIGTNNAGEWIASDPGSDAGWIMTAGGRFGAAFYNEFAPDAQDETLITARGLRVELNGTVYRNVIETADTTRLDPDGFERKLFAPGVGEVFSQVLSPRGRVLEENTLRLDTRVGQDDPSDAGETRLKLAALAEGQAVSDLAEVRDVRPADLTADGDEPLGVQLLTAPEGSDRLGWYRIDCATGRMGAGHLFPAGEDAALVRVGEGKALGLFLLADTAELGLDVDAAAADGLRFVDMQTGRSGHIDDPMPPAVTDAAGRFLPLQPIHLLGADDAGNTLNAGGGVGAVGLASGAARAADADLFGFESGNAMDGAYDGDFNDLFVAVSDGALSRREVRDLLHAIDGHAGGELFA